MNCINGLYYPKHIDEIDKVWILTKIHLQLIIQLYEGCPTYFFNTLENNDIENQKICFRSNNVNFKNNNSGEFKVVSKQYFGGMYQIEVSNHRNILINLMSDETISNDMKIGDNLNLSIETKDIIFLEDEWN